MYMLGISEFFYQFFLKLKSRKLVCYFLPSQNYHTHHTLINRTIEVVTESDIMHIMFT